MNEKEMLKERIYRTLLNTKEQLADMRIMIDELVDRCGEIELHESNVHIFDQFENTYLGDVTHIKKESKEKYVLLDSGTEIWIEELTIGEIITLAEAIADFQLNQI